MQAGRERQWGIYQKQTGADRLSLAGALSCNAHGRGLTLGPIVQQVESFDLVDADGEVRTCSRSRNAELFGLAIGGYGLFGVIARVSAAAAAARESAARRRARRDGDIDASVRRTDPRRLPLWRLPVRDRRRRATAFSAAASSRAISRCRRRRLSPNIPTRFNPEDWARLTFYSHKYKRRAFEVYTTRYLRTSGQIYWADSQLSAAYVDNYHADLDRATAGADAGN